MCSLGCYIVRHWERFYARQGKEEECERQKEKKKKEKTKGEQSRMVEKINGLEAEEQNYRSRLEMMAHTSFWTEEEKEKNSFFFVSDGDRDVCKWSVFLSVSPASELFHPTSAEKKTRKPSF